MDSLRNMLATFFAPTVRADFDRCLLHQDWWVMLGVLLQWQGEMHPCRWAVQKWCREGRDEAKNNKLLVIKEKDFLIVILLVSASLHDICSCEFDLAHSSVWNINTSARSSTRPSVKVWKKTTRCLVAFAVKSRRRHGSNAEMIWSPH